MGVFDNYPQAVDAALRSRGLKGDCTACGKNDWVIHETPVSLPVYEKAGSVTFPGTSMPTAALICKNCGWTGLFSLGALGLINKPQDQQLAGATTPAGEPAAAPSS